MTMVTVPEFDWTSWHRDGLLFAREIYRSLPRYIPFRYEIPETDNSGTIESFDVTEEAIDSLIECLQCPYEDREPVLDEKVITLAKDDEGALGIKFKIKEKNREFVFHFEYPSMTFLKVFLEKIVISKGEPVGWDSKYSRSGMYFYPQTIGGLKHMGQLHIYTEGKSKADFTAYVNIRHFIRSVYRTVMTNLGHVDGEAVYKKMQSNMLEWYIDDVRYDKYSFLRNKPSLAKWLSPAIMQVKDFFTNFYDSIYDEDV
jgi:hypothetical protein